MFRRLLIAILSLWCASAQAQNSSPNFQEGQLIHAYQLNNAFQGKVDAVNGFSQDQTLLNPVFQGLTNITSLFQTGLRNMTGPWPGALGIPINQQISVFGTPTGGFVDASGTNFPINLLNVKDSMSLAVTQPSVVALEISHSYGDNNVSSNGARISLLITSSLNLNSVAPGAATIGAENPNFVGEYIVNNFSGNVTGATNTNPLGGMWATDFSVTVGPFSYAYGMTGTEYDLSINSGGVVRYAEGIKLFYLTPPGWHSLSGTEAFIRFENNSTGLNYGLYFGEPQCGGGCFPISTTGTMIYSVAGTAGFGIDFSNVTFGTAFLKGPGGFLVDGAGNITANSVVFTGGIQSDATVDPSLASASQLNWNFFNTTLNYSTGKATIFQNNASYVTVNSGSSTAEINLYHGQLTIDHGASVVSGAEVYEASMNNLGTTNGVAMYLALPTNGTTGVVSGSGVIIGTKYQLNQFNTTSGAVNGYFAIDNEAMEGGGSVPTFYNFIRNADPNGAISSIGGLNLGSLVIPSTGTLLQIAGLDNSGGTTVVSVKNLAGTPLFSIGNAGTVGFAGGAFVDPSGNVNGTTAVVGGTGAGGVSFKNATSGSIGVQAPTGALGSQTLTLPDVTSTLAILGAQTFTGTQTFADGGTWGSGGISTGSINATGSVGYKILNTAVINLLSNQTSPILSPEFPGQQPIAASDYIPAPIIMGYATTITSATPGTYANQFTINLTVTGTTTNHWGLGEDSINLLGTGNFSGELNVKKSAVDVPAGLTLGSGENQELEINNSGNVATWAGIVINPSLFANGTFTGGVYGVKFTPISFNSGSGTWQSWTAINCAGFSGGGSVIPIAGQDICLANFDDAAVITNTGHYGARPGGSVPTVTCNGSGSPAALDTRASDNMATVTTNTSATSCTVTFGLAYPFGNPHVMVTPQSGVAVTAVTPGQSSFSFTFASSTAATFTYHVMASW